MSSHRSATAFLIGASASWGVGTVVSKQVLSTFPPLPLLGVQLFVSSAALLVVAILTGHRIDRNRDTAKAAALGVLNPGLAYALGLIGLTYISASTAVLLWAIEPVLIACLAALILHERLPRSVYVFMAIAVLGVLLVVYEPGVGGNVFGVIITIVAILCCAVYTVLARALAIDQGALSVTLVQQMSAFAFAVALAVVVAGVTGTLPDLSAVGPTDWAGAAISGLLYYALAFWLYLSGLRGVSAGVAGAFLTLIPVFGVAAAFVVGERLEPWQWAGGVVVITSMAFLMRTLARTEEARHGDHLAV
ncbi:MAG TPA: DMT family transporter [Actinomycetes bacterium]|nr:DMT family transporter [Actinomycetes bacterium]